MWCILVTLGLTFVSACGTARAKSAAPMNVLFLASDDMRPQLGAYQNEMFPVPEYMSMHTPHLDALARRSMLLKKSFVQVKPRIWMHWQGGACC